MMVVVLADGDRRVEGEAGCQVGGGTSTAALTKQLSRQCRAVGEKEGEGGGSTLAAAVQQGTKLKGSELDLSARSRHCPTVFETPQPAHRFVSPEFQPYLAPQSGDNHCRGRCRWLGIIIGS